MQEKKWHISSSSSFDVQITSTQENKSLCKLTKLQNAHILQEFLTVDNF